MIKMCRTCAQEKNVSEFYAGQATCKECYKAKVRKHRAENLEACQAYDRERGTLPHRKKAVADRAHKYKDAPYRQSATMRAKAGPEKNIARAAVANAVRGGRIVRPSSCESCHGADRSITAHHDDYSRPLDVRWLCTACHGAAHKALNEAARGAESASP